jgi:hypothetical protein
MKQSWFKQEAKEGASHKQRAIFVLKQRQVGSSQENVIKQISILEEMIGSLVRETYTRASNATHINKGRSEAKKILNYFDAFAHDLLDLD